MIHVAVFCAGSQPSAGRFCAPIEDTVPLADVERWHAEALAKHAWTVDADGETYYCPRHNPADHGAPVVLVSGEYTALGDSGWEARLPEPPGVPQAVARIEIRQRRGGDDA